VLFQTDPELQFNAKSDCYLFDILKIHELVGKHEFTREQIRDIRRVSVRTNFMGKDGYLNAKGISGISMVASGLTGYNVYMRRVGSNSNYNYIIAEYQRRIDSSSMVDHFVLANFEQPNKVVDYDPWSFFGSRTVREGNIVGFRYIFAEAV